MREVVQQLQQLSPEALHEKCKRVNSRRALADWQMAACLLACEYSQLFRRHECSGVVQYAVKCLDMDAQKASELLRAAVFMEHLSSLSEAFRTGRVGWGKVRVLKSVMTPETEEEWLAYALTHSVAELERAVAMNSTEWKRRAQNATLASPKVRPGGVTADLFAVDRPEAAGVAAPTNVARGQGARDLQIEPIHENASNKCSARSASRVGARELEPTAGEPTPGPAVCGEQPAAIAPEAAKLPRPPAQPQLVRVTLLFTPEQYVAFQESESHIRKLLPTKRARREAVVAEMARRSLAATSARTRARHTVVVHINANTEAAWFETDRGTLPVSADELSEALTTGTITYADELPSGPSGTRTSTEHFSPGKRKRQPIPVHILRQLYARAGGCCEVPGCSNRQHLHAHHRKAWSRGGTNDLDCLELRCSACHDLNHEEDYRKDRGWSRARAQARKKRSSSG